MLSQRKNITRNNRMEGLGQKIAERIIHESAKIISLYPGSFSPPHRGHVEVAKRAAQHVDELHIIISNNIREGYTPEVSLKVWKQYIPLLPENVKVKISTSSSPITEIYNIVKDKTNNYIVVYGKGEKDRYNSINENREKYSNVDIIDAGNFDDISSTSLREAIRIRNRLAIKSLIPEGIKVDDFLMNFQLHEIKVNTPGFKSVIDVINLIKQIREKYRTLQSNDQLYYINKIEDIKDKYGDVITFRNTKEFLEALPGQELNKIYKEYESLLNLNEIKVNQPFNYKKAYGESHSYNEFLKTQESTQRPPDYFLIDVRDKKIIASFANMNVPKWSRLVEDWDDNYKVVSKSAITNPPPYLSTPHINIEDSSSWINKAPELLNVVKDSLNEEKIPGGLSSGLTLQDIADKHKANISSLRKQLQKGIKVELEHTTSKDVAEEIAMDHLFEDPKYYDKLASIEEIKVNMPGKIPYQDFQDLIHSVKIQSELSDILEKHGYDMSGDNIPDFYNRIKDTSTLPKLVGIMMGMEKREPRRVDEAKSVGDVYHFSNLNGLRGILDDNKFYSSVTAVDDLGPDFKSFRKKESDFKDKGIEYLNYFSTTRNKNLWKNDPKIGGSLVRIKLDGNKLSNNYKFVPFYYYSDEMDTNNVHPKISQDESEERINLGTKKEIPNAKNYIKEIDVFLDKLGDNTRVLKLIQELQTKYPQVKTLYKDKEISVEQYISDILPTIEPYHEVDEIKVNKPGLYFPTDKNWHYYVKDKEAWLKILPILNRDGYKWLSENEIKDDFRAPTFPAIISHNIERYPNKIYNNWWGDYEVNNFLKTKSVINPNDVPETINESKLLKEVFQKEHAPILNKAVQYAMKYLDIPKPNVILINNPEYTKEHHSFGGYAPGDKSIRVVTYNRNLADITRSMFHEMVHLKQDIEGRLKPESGQDGDEWENECNSTAATMMRKFSRENPEIFE